VQVSDFRPIYYLGCKTSFADAIAAAINEVDPTNGRLCDLFAGTGAVAAALGSSREVTTVDVQEYSRVLCEAVLCPPALNTAQVVRITQSIAESQLAAEVLRCVQPLSDYEHECIGAAASGNTGPLVELVESPPLAVFESADAGYASSRLQEAMSEAAHRLRTAGLWESADTTVSRHFAGVYFSYRQGALLDATLAYAEGAEEGVRNALKAAALSTASQLVNTVGKQFAQPLRPRNKAGVVKANLVKVVQRDRSWDTLDTYRTWLSRYSALPRAIGAPRALRQDYLEALQEHAGDYSVLYADPPYTRDHYSRFYHVLETMCLRDNPTVSRVVKGGKKLVSRGLYREDRHQSPFCIRSTAPAAFEALFKAAREHDLPLVLSYSPHEEGDGTHPRVVSIEQITALARSHYTRVEVSVIDGSVHNNLNRNGLKLKTREHAELLVKCFR